MVLRWKTTLLRVLVGLLSPSSGGVKFHFGDNRLPRFGFMFQDHKLVPWLTLRENLSFGHARAVCVGERYEQVIELLGLGGHLDEYPSRLSGGLKERTALGRALIGNIDMLLLDEPLGSTDYVHRLKIEDYIYSRTRHEKISAVLVTHDLDQALANADVVVVLPASGSSRRMAIMEVPKAVRQFCPSRARLSPAMAEAMKQLISLYEDVL